MLEIRPVSDLRNKFPEVEAAVYEKGPVVLTKNGYGKLVLMSIEEYSNLMDKLEAVLDEVSRHTPSNPDDSPNDQVFIRG